jgi:hypothetical protein
MRVIALGALSGATGDREKGEEFTVEAKVGADLVQRGLVEPVTEAAAEKPAKAKE